MTMFKKSREVVLDPNDDSTSSEEFKGVNALLKKLQADCAALGFPTVIARVSQCPLETAEIEDDKEYSAATTLTSSSVLLVATVADLLGFLAQQSPLLVAEVFRGLAANSEVPRMREEEAEALISAVFAGLGFNAHCIDLGDSQSSSRDERKARSMRELFGIGGAVRF